MLACLVVAADFSLPLLRKRCDDFLHENMAGVRQSIHETEPGVLKGLLSQLPANDVLTLVRSLACLAGPSAQTAPGRFYCRRCRSSQLGGDCVPACCTSCKAVVD